MRLRRPGRRERPVLSRREIRLALGERPPDDVWRAVLGWSRRYDGRYHAMYYDELQAFHARQR